MICSFAFSQTKNIIKDIDGNIYKTVVIGDQEWLAENLKTTKFNDGIPIPNITNDKEWKSINKPAWCYYENDQNFNQKYGKLYNWYSVDISSNGRKNICPIGWHVPSYREWQKLIDFYGHVKGLGEESDGLHKKPGWEERYLQSILNGKRIVDKIYNSGFNCLKGGLRNSLEGEFGYLDKFGLWWSTADTYSCSISSDYSSIFGGDLLDIKSSDKSYGYFIRCLKDEMDK